MQRMVSMYLNQDRLRTNPHRLRDSKLLIPVGCLSRNVFRHLLLVPPIGDVYPHVGYSGQGCTFAV